MNNTASPQAFFFASISAAICKVDGGKIREYIKKTGLRYNPSPKPGQSKFSQVIKDDNKDADLPKLDSMEDLVMKGFMIFKDL